MGRRIYWANRYAGLLSAVAALLVQLFALLLLAFAETSSADSPAQDKAKMEQTLPIQVATDLITVRAVFLDAHGKRITNLSAEEVIVKDDGEPQTLTVFEPLKQFRPESNAGSVSNAFEGANANLVSAGDALNVLILLPGMQFADRHYALQAAAKYLQGEHDGHTFVSVADATGVTLPFTSQQSKMAEFGRALLKLQMPSAGWFGSWKYRQVLLASCLSLREMKGRRAIVLFTDYYRADNRAIRTLQPDDLLPPAMDADAAIYPVDARGLQPEIPFGDASSTGVPVNESIWSFTNVMEMNDLTGLAVETGGSYAVGNDLGSVFQRTGHDASASYILAYYKHNLRLDGSFHPVKVECKRRGIRAQARSGYFARVGGIRELSPENQLKMLLASERPFDDVKVKLRPYFFPFDEAGEDSVVAALGMAFEWISPGAGPGAEMHLSVLGTVRGPGDASGDTLFQDRLEPTTTHVSPAFSLWQASVNAEPIQLAPGDHAVKVAARSETGELGSAFLELSVPAQPAHRFRISSLVVARQTETAASNKTRAGFGDPLEVGNERIVPQASNQFEDDGNLIFYARVRGAVGGSPLIATLSFQKQSGERILRSLTSDLLTGSDALSYGVPVLFKLPASEFPGKDGPFLAILTIKQREGKTAGTVSAAFEILPAQLH